MSQVLQAPPPALQAQGLLGFNRELLDQALGLVAAHEGADAPGYAGPVGAHLRHVIEHYEALLLRAEGAVVAYDHRARDRALERCTVLARQRLTALSQVLAAADEHTLQQAVLVHGLGGTAGEFEFVVGSSVGRELAFVASHAVHHFALLHAHCVQHGIRLGQDFGKAPATVAFERGVSPQALQVNLKEVTCSTSLQAA